MAEYSFDTNIFIESWHRRYPRDIFPKLWDRLDELIDDGTIVATEEVKTELEQKDDDVLGYVKQRPKLFEAVDDEQQEIVGDIINQFANENWDILNARKNKADPYVTGPSQMTCRYNSRKLFYGRHLHIFP